MGPLLLLAAAAATGYQSSPPRRTVVPRTFNHWIAGYRAQLLPSMERDFGEKYLYAAANAALPPPAPAERRVVFLGDSITDRWDLARAFPGRPYVNRGIGGQVTAQMVLRFHADVVALRPAAVVILAGINDLTDVLQEETDNGIEANWQAMAEMARAHGIAVVFASVMPVNNYTANARDMLKDRDPARIAALNRWLRGWCAEQGYGFADYAAAVTDARGLLRADLTQDGLHPDAAGYARMAPVAEAAIGRALAATPAKQS